ncbi:RING-HC_RNF170 domain-containing protein [Notolabrus celidotus]|uniref:RING-HC_RNF170 domain-containing protein n=1 Tax=Notolabrus celidotus TaxID=1203425 RepID=UPI001490158A|nr:RING-HC_RNF170 domain-containing protein [Notolabrus celidotus]XP_034564717.1 RING-HC_RNF170 domain-containing protein [Notolabrus celidotus]
MTTCSTPATHLCSAQLRPECPPSDDPAAHLRSPISTLCTPEQSASCWSFQQDSCQSCPVCLQTASFPVQTNCGHLFCAPCLMAYWRHGSWLDAISCPLCRQKVSVLCHLFKESRSDRQSKEVLVEISDYNKRYSGAPRRITDYLCDAPLLLQVLVRGLGTMGGLVWLFLFRVALCCVGTVVSISSPPLDPASSAGSPLETDPSLCGLLGVLDDLVVVILLLICVININQQMAPDTEEQSGDTAS